MSRQRTALALLALLTRIAYRRIIATPRELRYYLTPWGKNVCSTWLTALRDLRGRVVIERRIDRLELDQPRDHAYCRDGVWELRVDAGPGYRVYFAQDANAIVLLGIGDKSSQARDIERAIDHWKDYKRRKRP